LFVLFGLAYYSKFWNIFVPQSIQSNIELAELVDVRLQLIKATSSTPIYGCIIDTLLASYVMTQKQGIQIDWRTYMNLVASIKTDDLHKVNKNKKYTSLELYSELIPEKINHKSGTTEIVAGIVKSGPIGQELLKAGKNGLSRLIMDAYSEIEAGEFLANCQRLALNWNQYYGFSMGIGDTDVTPTALKKRSEHIKTKCILVQKMITELENNPNLMDHTMLEGLIKDEFNTILMDIGDYIMKDMKDDNKINIIINSGAAGSITNISQISGCSGQVTLEGTRMKKTVNNRSLPYFFQNDDTGPARGLIKHGFFEGFSWPEFVYSHMAAREGLIESAIKSVTGDTPIIIEENGKIKYTEIGNWIDELLEKEIDRVEYHKFRDMELLKLQHPVKIPTCDANGNVTWGDVTAITRHDPGKELYEIKTKSGRSVIVTESKSLLIWNEDKKQFLHTSTPEVKIGDFVPVTRKLPMLHSNTQGFTTDTNDNRKLFDKYYIDTVEGNIRKNQNGYGDDISKEYFPDELFYSDNYAIEWFISDLSDYAIDIIGPMADLEVTQKTAMLANMTGRFCILDKQITIEEWDGRTDMGLTTRSLTELGYSNYNDVVLDPIIEINKIDIAKYPKVYDLTVPSTLNFGLANGLHVVDTAESGYVQRKLIKLMEDVVVRYDNTIRTSTGAIYQFIYGDNGINTTKQYPHDFSLLAMDNKKIKSIYQFDNNKHDGKIYNDTAFYNMIITTRDKFREIMRKTKLNFITLESRVSIPINIKLIVDDIKNHKRGSTKLTADYIMQQIDELLTPKYTSLVAMSKSKMNDKDNIKYKNDQVSKQLFRIVLYEALAPKRCIDEYKLTKEQFDDIFDNAVTNFKDSRVEPGDMIGIIAAQSMGENTTQVTLKAFHTSGIAKKGDTGVGRMKELLSYSKHLKTPKMYIYLKPEVMADENIANKITYHLKHTTIKDLRMSIGVYFDPDPNNKDSIMSRDNVTRKFHNISSDRDKCTTNYERLPWVIRIVLDREKMFTKEVTLLDIKTKFCNDWEKKYNDLKSLKREEKIILEKITNVSVLSNFDNDRIPTIHIRFDMTEISLSLMNNLIDDIIDKFKIKGIPDINDVSNDEERILTFDPITGECVNKTNVVLYSDGINMNDIRGINNIDLNKTFCNNVAIIYDMFGIEAARQSLYNEYSTVFSGSNAVNYQHMSILLDTMCNSGIITSIDRHGMNKLDSEPLSAASFEKPVERLNNAAVFAETDNLKSISSRIMAGLPMIGGTGFCNLILDTHLLEHSEIIPTEHVDNLVEENGIITNMVKHKKSKTFVPQ